LNKGEAQQFADAAVGAHSPAKEPLVNMLTNWVQRVNARVPTGSTSTSRAAAAARPAKESNTRKYLLIALGILILGGLLLILGIYVARRRRQEQALVHRRNQLKRRINDCAKDVLDLETDVRLNDNAEAAYSNGVI